MADQNFSETVTADKDVNVHSIKAGTQDTTYGPVTMQDFNNEIQGDNRGLVGGQFTAPVNQGRSQPMQCQTDIHLLLQIPLKGGGFRNCEYCTAKGSKFQDLKKRIQQDFPGLPKEVEFITKSKKFDTDIQLVNSSVLEHDGVITASW